MYRSSAFGIARVRITPGGQQNDDRCRLPRGAVKRSRIFTTSRMCIRTCS